MKRAHRGSWRALVSSLSLGFGLAMFMGSADAARPSGEIGKDWGASSRS